jgi:uncharacterized membrane protein
MKRPAGESDTGWDSNFAAALSYVLGLVSALVFLAIEKKDEYVRFHAMQSAFTFAAVLIARVLISALPVAAGILNVSFAVGVAALWVVLIVEALRGRRYKLPYIGDLAEQQLARRQGPRP